MSVVCNVRAPAPYPGGWKFRQYFFAILYFSHPWPPCKILRKSRGGPLRRSVKRKTGSKIERCHVRVSQHWWKDKRWCTRLNRILWALELRDKLLKSFNRINKIVMNRTLTVSKLEIIVYKKLNAERSNIAGNSRGNFSKDIFSGIPGGLGLLRQPSILLINFSCLPRVIWKTT